MSLVIAQVVVGAIRSIRSGRRGIRAAVPAARRHTTRSASRRCAKDAAVVDPAGVVALWPLFAWRWIAGAHEPIEDNPHRAKARESLAAAGRAGGLAR